MADSDRFDEGAERSVHERASQAQGDAERVEQTAKSAPSSDRFADNPTASYLEAISNAMKAGDMEAAVVLLTKLATFDPDAAQAVMDLVETLKELTGGK